MFGDLLNPPTSVGGRRQWRGQHPPPPPQLPFTNSSSGLKGGDSEMVDREEPNSQGHPHPSTHPNAFLICRKEAEVHPVHSTWPPVQKAAHSQASGV